MTGTIRKPLSVGDRVRVWSGEHAFKATVFELMSDGYVRVQVESTEPTKGYNTVHPNQCRRLKPRAKKAPDRRPWKLWKAWDYAHTEILGGGGIESAIEKFLRALGLPEEKV